MACKKSAVRVRLSPFHSTTLLIGVLRQKPNKPLAQALADILNIEDLKLYRVPEELETLLRILAGILLGNEEPKPLRDYVTA